MEGIFLPLQLCKGTFSSLRTVEMPTDHVTPECMAMQSNSNLYLDQSITNNWCQAITDTVSYPSDSLNAIRLGLRSSLPQPPLSPCHGWLAPCQIPEYNGLSERVRIEHVMKTSWYGNAFLNTGPLCRNSPVQHRSASSVDLLCIFLLLT